MLSYEDCVSFCRIFGMEKKQLNKLLNTASTCGEKLRAAIHAKICEDDGVLFRDVLISKDGIIRDWERGPSYECKFKVRGIFDYQRDNCRIWNYHYSGDSLNGYGVSDRRYAMEPELFAFSFYMWTYVIECEKDFVELISMDDEKLQEEAENMAPLLESMSDRVDLFMEEFFMSSLFDDFWDDEKFDEKLFHMNAMRYGLLSAYYLDCFFKDEEANDKLRLKMNQYFSKVFSTEECEAWFGDDATNYNDYFFDRFEKLFPDVPKEARMVVYPLEILSHVNNDQSINESFPAGYFFRDEGLKKYKDLKEKKVIEKYVSLMEPLCKVMEDPFEIGDRASGGYELLSGTALMESVYGPDAYYYACVTLSDNDDSYYPHEMIAEIRRVFDRLVELYEQELSECL